VTSKPKKGTEGGILNCYAAADTALVVLCRSTGNRATAATRSAGARGTTRTAGASRTGRAKTAAPRSSGANKCSGINTANSAIAQAVENSLRSDVVW